MYVYICIYVHVDIYAYAYICICVYVYTCIYTCIYVCTTRGTSPNQKRGRNADKGIWGYKVLNEASRAECVEKEARRRERRMAKRVTGNDQGKESFNTYHFLLTTACLGLTTCYSLLIPYCLPLTTFYVLRATYHSRLTSYSIQRATYHIVYITYYLVRNAARSAKWYPKVRTKIVPRKIAPRCCQTFLEAPS